MNRTEFIQLPTLNLSSPAVQRIRKNGFTKDQQKAIRRRDRHRCQMNCELTRFCGGKHDAVDVHHIRSQSWCRRNGIDPNTLDNGITLCKTYHSSRHPYELSQDHSGNPNWDTDDDRILRVITASQNRKLFRKDYGSARKRLRRKLYRLFDGRMRLEDQFAGVALHTPQDTDSVLNRGVRTK